MDTPVHRMEGKMEEKMEGKMEGKMAKKQAPDGQAGTKKDNNSLTLHKILNYAITYIQSIEFFSENSTKQAHKGEQPLL